MTTTAHASASTPPTPASPGTTQRHARTSRVIDELTSCRDPDRRTCLQKQLIQLHMDVATSIAARYRSHGISSEDLQQVAYLGLTKAAQRFDPTSGHAFLTYAVPTIRGEVRRYFRDHGWMVRPPRRVQELQYRVWNVEGQLTNALGRAPTPNEMSRQLEVPLDEVLEALEAHHCYTLTSLDRPVGEDSQTVSVGDSIGSEDVSLASAEARRALAPAIQRLSERDRHVLKLRFYDGLTQSEIADSIGVTQVQVSRLLTRIYRDLRTHIGPLDGDRLPAHAHPDGTQAEARRERAGPTKVASSLPVL